MIIWSVEEGKLVKYERTGECNQCGQCCRKIIYQWDIKSGSPSDEGNKVEDSDWTGFDGWRMLYAQGKWFYFKISDYALDQEDRCPDLTDDNLCKSWKDPITFKPICRYWPFHPDDVAAFPGCEFSFRKLDFDPETGEYEDA